AFSANSGTGVSATRVPASPLTAASSPYWLLGTAPIDGPLSIVAGTILRAGAAQPDATLGDIYALTADGTSAPITISNVSLETLAVSMLGVSLQGGVTTVLNELSMSDCVLLGHDLEADLTVTGALFERNVV